MGFTDDLRDKISDKVSHISLDFDNVEFILPISGRKVRLDGVLKLDNLRIGWGRKKRGRLGELGQGKH